MGKLHEWGFKTSMVIGDGVSSNLSMYKTLLGHSNKYFKINSDQPLDHYVKPHFVSPFTGDKVFIIVCPAHMVYNELHARHYCHYYCYS